MQSFGLSHNSVYVCFLLCQNGIIKPRSQDANSTHRVDAKKTIVEKLFLETVIIHLQKIGLERQVEGAFGGPFIPPTESVSCLTGGLYFVFCRSFLRCTMNVKVNV